MDTLLTSARSWKAWNEIDFFALEEVDEVVQNLTEATQTFTDLETGIKIN